MKILIVEDDIEYAEGIEKELQLLKPDLELSFAKSRDSAVSSVQSNFYDLVILDLKIPTIDGALDEEPEHGNAVFESILQHAPGTPIFVLTGSPGEPFIDRLTANVNQVDIWGASKLPTVSFLAKHRFGVFSEKIAPYLRDFATLSDVELQRSADPLSIEEDRILRIFSNQCKAAKCTVDLLTGGLSGARVFRAKFTSEQGALIHHAVTKIGPRPDVFDENDRFEKFVSRLEGKATPRKLALVSHGAGKVAGVLYSLAAGFDSNAFAIAEIDGPTSQSIIGELEKLTSAWRNGLPETRHQIRTIRQHAISDDRFSAIRPEISFDWIEEFERKHIQTIFACSHGDMHGLNVLATPEGNPILIDYGDVGDATACLDPITLELSLFFHVKGPLRDSAWPTAHQAGEWGNLDTYLVDCPMPTFIRACREWAIRSAAGNREIAATAYSYLVRQLKYDETDRTRIFSLLGGVKAFFDRQS
ncbi:response regulator [uncultured Herbaspirillum sp.]|uniref:response regulator n=1 Tax=uncultured Herbaspirillum sp. TaxID=160236 RepID=UPI0026386D51|nr:response regulator [uncultured Herbaspirillum sp.]